MRALKRRWLILLASVAICMAAWLLLANYKRPTIVLPDGSKLTPLKVTYGTNHSCVYGHGWREWIYPIMPQRIRTKLGARVLTLANVDSFSNMDTNSVVVWLSRTFPTNLNQSVPLNRPSSSLMLTSFFSADLNWRGNELLSVVDAHGLESKLLFPRAWVYPNLTEGLAAYELDNRPRRAATFSVRVYSWESDDKTRRIEEFTVRNRNRNKAPAWIPQRLPVTRQTNGLELTLIKLQTGLAQAGGDSAFARATFWVKENGKEITNWYVNRAELSDATGNWWWGHQYTIKNWGSGMMSIDFVGSLWPEEPAHRLRIILSQGEFARKDVAFEFFVLPVMEEKRVTGDREPPASE